MATDLGCLTTKTKCHFLTALNVDISLHHGRHDAFQTKFQVLQVTDTQLSQ